MAAVSVVSLFLGIAHGFSQTLTTPSTELLEVVVQDGDTLWQIARRYGDPDMDTRKMVDLIRTINDLPSAVVRPGQVLKVPVL